VYLAHPLLSFGRPMRIDKEELLYSSKAFVRFGIEKAESQAENQKDCNQRQQDTYHGDPLRSR
jgi:hypothetical protein